VVRCPEGSPSDRCHLEKVFGSVLENDTIRVTQKNQPFMLTVAMDPTQKSNF
jgi:hypothetical protein